MFLIYLSKGFVAIAAILMVHSNSLRKMPLEYPLRNSHSTGSKLDFDRIDEVSFRKLQQDNQPSSKPSSKPSSQQSASQPSFRPSGQPTSDPSSPSDAFTPSSQPSSVPSSQPSAQLSDQPSAQPSYQPSTQPSYQPSSQPSYQPSVQPSSQSSAQSSSQNAMLQNKNSEDSSDISEGAIIGIFFSCFIILSAIVGVTYYIKCRKRYNPLHVPPNTKKSPFPEDEFVLSSFYHWKKMNPDSTNFTFFTFILWNT